MNPAERNAQPRRYAERKLEGPRRVRNGIKLHGLLRPAISAEIPESQQGRFDMKGRSDLGERWLGLFENFVEQSQLDAAFEYARSGQIVSIDVKSGLIEAQVQGTLPRPYATQIQLPHWSEEQWDRAIDAMTGEAKYAARLLTNEIPAELDELLFPLELSLLPNVVTAIKARCTCSPDAALSRCKHVGAVAYIMAERLADSPVIVFTLLGKPLERVLERLRRARTIQAHGVASAHADPMIPESQVEPQPLEACIDEFWRGDLDQLDADVQPPTQHAPHALLRRLGPSPLNGRFPITGLLASVYDTVSQAARRLRDECERSARSETDVEGSVDSAARSGERFSDRH